MQEEKIIRLSVRRDRDFIDTVMDIYDNLSHRPFAERVRDWAKTAAILPLWLIKSRFGYESMDLNNNSSAPKLRLLQPVTE